MSLGLFGRLGHARPAAELAHDDFIHLLLFLVTLREPGAEAASGLRVRLLVL
jgi:hypothetical protein